MQDLTPAPRGAGTPLRGIVCMLLGVILLCLNDALIKSLTLGYPVGELLFVRGMFVCPWVLMLAYRAGGLRSLRVVNVEGQAWRGLCVVAGSFLFVTTVVVTLAGLATAPWGWAPLRGPDLWVFASSGVLVAGAHYLMIEAFRHAEAALVAPFKYTSMIWAVLFGYLLFGDLPDAWTLAGAGVVVLAGFYVLRRETRGRRR